jgi:hypothetical protein
MTDWSVIVNVSVNAPVSRRRDFRDSLNTVIASEAKQSIPPRKEKMDCFVASAPVRKRFAFVAGNDGYAAIPQTVSSPATGSAEWPPDDRLRRAIQYAAASRFYHRRLWDTGSSAFADDDN